MCSKVSLAKKSISIEWPKLGIRTLRCLTFMKNCTYREDDSREPLLDGRTAMILIKKWSSLYTDMAEMHWKPGGMSNAYFFRFNIFQSEDGLDLISWNKMNLETYFEVPPTTAYFSRPKYFCTEILFDYFSLKDILFGRIIFI